MRLDARYWIQKQLLKKRKKFQNQQIKHRKRKKMKWRKNNW